MLVTFSTQPASQPVVQQAGVSEQMRPTQPGVGGSSHPATRAAPAAHTECAHAPWLAAQERLSQIVLTSPTQVESQLVPQQYESEAQMAAMHGSHVGTSATPTSQCECGQD